jgi:hypothetical protein
MAGGKSDYLELELLDHVLGGADYARPGTVYVGLFTATPSDTGGGTEVSTNNYSRAAVTNNPTNFPAAAAGLKSNGTDIPFPVPSGSWGTIVAWGLFDAASGGNLLYWGPITPNQAVVANAVVKIPAGAMDITED